MRSDGSALYDAGVMVLPLALTAAKATIGLLFVFLVLLPAIITGLLLFAAAQIKREHDENNRYLDAAE